MHIYRTQLDLKFITHSTAGNGMEWLPLLVNTIIISSLKYSHFEDNRRRYDIIEKEALKTTKYTITDIIGEIILRLLLFLMQSLGNHIGRVEHAK